MHAEGTAGKRSLGEPQLGLVQPTEICITPSSLLSLSTFLSPASFFCSEYRQLHSKWCLDPPVFLMLFLSLCWAFPTLSSLSKISCALEGSLTPIPRLHVAVGPLATCCWREGHL